MTLLCARNTTKSLELLLPFHSFNLLLSHSVLNVFFDRDPSTYFNGLARDTRRDSLKMSAGRPCLQHPLLQRRQQRLSQHSTSLAAANAAARTTPACRVSSSTLTPESPRPKYNQGGAGRELGRASSNGSMEREQNRSCGVSGAATAEFPTCSATWGAPTAPQLCGPPGSGARWAGAFSCWCR
jgi:hypothetical protein